MCINVFSNRSQGHFVIFNRYGLYFEVLNYQVCEKDDSSLTFIPFYSSERYLRRHDPLVNKIYKG